MAEPRESTWRIASIDLLRGIVMVTMLLDHVRDMVHRDAPRFSATDLERTNLALFFTRWVTHFCAPVFVLLAGVAARRQLRAKGRGALSWFLLTRGLWLIVLELTAVRLGAFFSLDPRFVGFLQVIWAIGISMVVMAALVQLPPKAVAAIGLAIVVLHNLLDGVGPAPADKGVLTPPSTIVWMLLHRPGLVLLPGDHAAYIAYPFLAWIGVMAAGYGLGAVYDWEAERRRRFLMRLGLASVAAFVVLRATGVYGDANRLAGQPTAARAVMAFLNTTKYPPSLQYLLMTLGPALLALAALERVRAERGPARALVTLGRVPLAYYLLQWPFAHAAALLLGSLAGQDVHHLFQSPPGVFNPDPSFGFGLPVVYATWVVGVVLLYPICAAYGRLKRTRPAWWMSYL